MTFVCFGRESVGEKLCGNHQNIESELGATSKFKESLSELFYSQK